MAATLLLVLVVVLVAGGLVFGIITLISGDDPGLGSVDPDKRARPLPNNRSLTESDLKTVRFDVAVRGYRMAQVDRVLRRTAYDVGYKDEMIAVLEAEVAALRDGRLEDADLLRKAREAAASPAMPAAAVSTFPGFAQADDAIEAGEVDDATVATAEPSDAVDGLDPAGDAVPGGLGSDGGQRSDGPDEDIRADEDVTGVADAPYDPTTDTGPGRLARRPAVDSGSLNGSVDGGSADGGSVDGGSADGGSVDGGSADGGSVDASDDGPVDPPHALDEPVDSESPRG